MISLILVVVFLVVFININGRISRIERLLSEKEEKQAAPMSSAGNAASTSAPAPQPTSSSGVATAFKSSQQPDMVEKFVEWAKEEWLMKLGALFLLMGLGWFVRYAFLHNWIGPMGRITLGLIFGVLVLVLGWWRIQKFSIQGGIFLVLGSTAILLTIFAAREIYDYFTPAIALGVMFLSTVFVALASVRFRIPWLALASLTLAGAAPVLTAPPQPNMVGLFSYLLVVTLGSIWVSFISGYKEMTLGALVLIWFYSLPQFFGYSPDREIILVFDYVFAIVFFATNTAGIVKAKTADIKVDLITAGGNGLLLLCWILFAAQRDLRSLIISAWMVVFAVGAYLVFTSTGKRIPFYIYGSVALMFLAAATSSELDGPSLTIAYILETGLVSLVLYGVMKDLRVVERAHLLFLGPGMLSLISIGSSSWHYGVFHKDYWTIFIFALLLLALGSFYRMKIRAGEVGRVEMYIILLIAGSLYAYILLWLATKAALPHAYDTAVMICLVLYTIAGLFKYFFGIATRRKVPKTYGLVLLGGVVTRLLFVDVWNMELVGKVITFVFIGTLLISTAFFSRKEIFQRKI